MPRGGYRSNLSPAQRAATRLANQKTVNGFNNAFTLPQSGISATTTGPSVRNLIYNVKSIPSDFKAVGQKIGSGLSSLVKGINSSGGARQRGARPGGARGGALQSKMGPSK